MPWTEKRQSAQRLQNITTEQFFDPVTLLDPDALAFCQVQVTFPPNPIGEAIVRVYGTLDDDNEIWDDDAIHEVIVEKVFDARKVSSFTVTGVYRFRVGIQSTGSAVDADFVFRLSREP
jgi:hypothetical protein